MILMIEKGIRDRICEATHRYAKVNNKYMNNYDKNNESLYIEYLDANNLYGWTVSVCIQMQSIQNNYLIFIKIYHFYPKEKKLKKVEKLICSIEDKGKYVIHIRTLKQTLNHGLVLRTQSNSIYSKKSIKTIHLNEY